ncbi:MAG: ABC transporter ATP-binding protein [Sandaracinaceae bacterium]|nr:ABC transporter ATP-binding protein [Sandaracinaceae bacterium]
MATNSPKRLSLKSSFAEIPRTIALVWHVSRAQTIGLLALTLASAGLPLAIAWVGKAIIDAVVAHDSRAALRFVLLELGIVAAQALVQRALTLLRLLMGAKLSVHVNTIILQKAITLDLSYFEDPEFYDRLTRARREASSRPISVVNETFQLLQNALTLIGYVALLLQFSGWAVLLLVAAALPATVAEMRYSAKAFRLRNWRAPETRRMFYLEHVLATETHAKEVQAFGLGPLLLGRYAKIGAEVYAEDARLATRRAWVAYALSLLATFAFYGCYVVLAIAAATQALSLGSLTLYVLAFRQGQQAFQSVLTAIGGMYEDNLYMSNLFSYLSVEPRRRTKPPAPAITTASTERGIRLEKIGFQYPGQEGWAVRDVSLYIAPGESLALVGQNGSGKTTLIKLLTGLYEPTEGRILLDGKDLRDYDRDELRKRMGVIFQDFNRYQLALKENVGVGSVDHLEENDRIERAIERGGAEEIVAGLKDKADTQLGRQFRFDGVELSGGQWQRIALARAFMREEADVLVLDEPTAALDAEAEQAVFERFHALAEGRTTILVSHRFPTVRSADRIVVLAGGRVEDEGTHDALLARDGRYARLFKLQAQGYL